MSTLFAALGTASNALDVLQEAIGVVQNNVTNASTPGYVTQTLQLNAGIFDPAGNVWGGVEAGDLQSARNSFAEQSVWNANQQAGMASQQATSLQALQSAFDVSGKTGIPAALSSLYSAFSAWSSLPSSTIAQQQVITAAQGVAQSFNQASSQVTQIQAQTRSQIGNVTTQINQLSSQIAALNGQIRTGSQHDAGVNAQLYNSLEQLSNLVDIKVHPESDGTVSVLMDGQVPLVIGTTQTQLQAVSTNAAGLGSNAAPHTSILTSNGQDVTALAQAGQLGGVLNVTNSVIPSLTGDVTQQGSLNQLAQAIADRVNGLLASGQTSSGSAGAPLFAYAAGSPTTTAGTLSVTSITTSQLAAADPGPPAVANGIASKLAALQTPQNPADMVQGLSYSDFYSGIAAGVGRQESSASTAQQTANEVLTQAQNLRSQLSGVSLDDQATQLMQFQQAYQASSQAISTINSTLQYFMSAMQQVQ